MNKHIFTSLVGRYVVPAALAGATFAGTVGFSSVASADERVVLTGPRAAIEVVAPSAAIEVAAPRPVPEVVVAPPAVEVVRPTPRVEVVPPAPRVEVVERVRRRPIVEVVNTPVAPYYGVYGAPGYLGYGGVYGRPGWGAYNGARGGAVIRGGGEWHGGARR